MNAAEQLVLAEAAPLPWSEICARYPDQFVCLVDVVTVALRSPTIASAKVVGCGSTRRQAFDPIRNELRYGEWTVVFTGTSNKPLRRPAVVFDR